MNLKLAFTISALSTSSSHARKPLTVEQILERERDARGSVMTFEDFRDAISPIDKNEDQDVAYTERRLAGQGQGQPSSGQGQPSSKFAAVWDDAPVVALINFIVEGSGSAYDVDFATLDLDQQSAQLGRIKVPQGNELLVTLSSEIILATNHNAVALYDWWCSIDEEAGADTLTYVNVVAFAEPSNPSADPIACQPGGITMSGRLEILENDIYTDDEYIVSSVNKYMEQASSHSFQWVCADLPADTYNIRAAFFIYADTEQIGFWTGEYFAAAALGKRIMTVQEVRAVKGVFNDALDLTN